MIIDLTKFCGSGDDYREFMRTPFARGQFIYATNGHICVRITRPDGDATPEKDVIPRVEKMFIKAASNPKTFRIPTLNNADPCYACGGSGVRYRCDECEGEGVVNFGRHEYDCKQCDGDGQITGENLGLPTETCKACDGYGFAPYQAIAVGPAHYDIRYLMRIVDLPGLLFFPGTAVAKDSNSATTAYFTFDGGEGMLMPMRP